VLDGFNSIRAMFKDKKIMKISQKNNVNTKQKRETYKIASSKTLANANKRKIESLESLIKKKGKIVDYLTDVISLWLVLLY
jgi:hypothetical protein